MAPRTSTEKNAPAFALSLTEHEVKRLLEDKSPATLIEMTGKIAGAYTRSNLKVNDTMAAEQIFRLLLRETELRVRVALAQQVKDSTIIPHDIVMTLAQDVAEVALPILQYSEVLSDSDLVDLISNTEEISYYLAISNRASVSDMVSDRLIEKGNGEVAAALVNNDGAILSESGLQKLIEHHPGNEALMEAISKKPALPVTVTEKLINVVSETLAATLRSKYHLNTPQLEQEIEKTRESETSNLIRLAKSEAEVDKLVNQLAAFNRLTPPIILSALCQGNFHFFESSLARLSSIPVSNAVKLINDRGDLGFRAIYNKSGLPEAMFPAVKLLLKVVHELDEAGVTKPGTNRYANSVVERIVQYSEDEPVENLSYIIALVRRVVQ